MTNGGDGFWTAIDPTNPNIVYAESQYGGMIRYDKQSGEILDIRPNRIKEKKHTSGIGMHLSSLALTHQLVYIALLRKFLEVRIGETHGY